MHCSVERRMMSAIQAQEQILKAHVTSQYEPLKIQLSDGNYMNGIVAGTPGKPALVVLHGWGAGLAFFAKNIDHLAAHFRVYLLDWLGCGASSRPDFPKNASVHETEQFFLPALHEALQQVAQTERKQLHLCAHSLGSYLAVSYLLKRRPVVPVSAVENVAVGTADDVPLVKHIILASPAGVPPAPAVPLEQRVREAPLKYKLLYKTWISMWNSNVTPQRLVRTTGETLGRKLAAGYINKRLSHLSEEERERFTQYLYAISNLPGSGEYAIKNVFRPDVTAKEPLCEKIPDIDERIHVSFLYGDVDWMDPKGGEIAIKNMKAAGKEKVAQLIIENAGHHLYLDNPPEFNRLVVARVQHVEQLTAVEA